MLTYDPVMITSRLEHLSAARRVLFAISTAARLALAVAILSPERPDVLLAKKIIGHVLDSVTKIQTLSDSDWNALDKQGVDLIPQEDEGSWSQERNAAEAALMAAIH